MIRLAWLVPFLLVSQAAAMPPPEVSLPDLIREALERNPEVQMARRMVEARRARVPQAGALPDPMLMYGVMNEGRPVPFQTLGTAGFSEVYVGVSQEIPYPGKRGLREKVAGEEASAAEWAYDAARRRIAAEVAQAYYDLYAVHAAFAIVERNFQLLDQLVKVARARYAVGQATQQDVLDADVELSRLEERRSLLFQRRGVVEASIARLLDRREPSTLGAPAPVSKTPLALSLQEALTRADERSPVLKEQASLVDAGGRKVDLALTAGFSRDNEVLYLSTDASDPVAAALEKDGEASAGLKATIEKFRADEIQHRDTALEHGAEEAPGYRVLSEAIKAGCRLAIKLSERF